MIKVILWDVDGTLLDFSAAEKAALRACFSLFGLGECTDGMVARYAAVNVRYWERLERGEISKARVLTGRFEEFFAAQGIAFDKLDAFNDEYQQRLGDTIVFNDDAYALVKGFKGRVKQYAVTNGTLAAQRRKLARSGLGKLFDGVFISDALGVEKPNIEFFEHVFANIVPCEKSEALIVGDSLTSDMRGGNNAGIRCC